MKRCKKEIKAYIYGFTNLLGIARNDSNDREGTQLSVFAIEVDTITLTARLSQSRSWEKLFKARTKIFLQSRPVTFLRNSIACGFPVILLACISGYEVQSGPLSPMGRLADGYPMRTEETFIKRLSHTVKVVLSKYVCSSVNWGRRVGKEKMLECSENLKVFFFFFPSSLTSIYNPLGYERLRLLRT